jgi:hypothetical protein
MRPDRLAVVAAVVLAVVLARLGAARAEDAPTSPQVILIVAGPTGVAEALSDRLGPRFAEREVGLQVTNVPSVDIETVLHAADEAPAANVLARVWIDAQHDPKAAVVLLMPRQSDRLLARRVPLRSGFDQVALVEIDFVLDRAVASLLDSQSVGVPLAEARETLARELGPPAAPVVAAPSPKPPASVAVVAAPPSSPGPDVALDVAAFAGVGTVTTEGLLTPAIGASVGLWTALGAWRVAAAVDGRLHQSTQIETTDVDVDVRGSVVHGFVEAGRPAGWRGTLSAKLGLGASFTQVTPHARAGSTIVLDAPPRLDIDLDLLVGARWSLLLGKGTTAFVEGAVDFVPRSERYTASIDGRADVIFSLPSVRPALFLGLSYAFGA